MLAHPPVQKAELLLLGDRNYPLHPTIKVSSVFTAPLAGLLTEAQTRLPDVTYEDLLKAVWALGVHHLTKALAEGYVVERQGVLKKRAPEPPKPEPPKPPQPDLRPRGPLGEFLNVEVSSDPLGMPVAVVNEPDGSLT